MDGTVFRVLAADWGRCARTAADGSALALHPSVRLTTLLQNRGGRHAQTWNDPGDGDAGGRSGYGYGGSCRRRGGGGERSVRTADNVKLDEGRKPNEVLNFLGLEKGMRVIDMFGANLYWAEIMAPVVGPRGRVTVWQPTQFLNDKRRKNFAAFAAAPNAALIVRAVRGDEPARQRATTS